MAVRYIAEGLTLPDHADIRGTAHIATLDDVRVYGPGPSGAYTTAHRDSTLGVRVTRGCLTGTIADFEAAIPYATKNKPEMRAAALEYLAAIRIHFNANLP